MVIQHIQNLYFFFTFSNFIYKSIQIVEKTTSIHNDYMGYLYEKNGQNITSKENNSFVINNFGYYHCHNKNFIASDIQLFKVNDGVCDYDLCCDGSDEYLTNKCENKCIEISKQYNEMKQKFKSYLKIKELILENQNSEIKLIERNYEIYAEVLNTFIKFKKVEIFSLSLLIDESNFQSQIQSKINEILTILIQLQVNIDNLFDHQITRNLPYNFNDKNTKFHNTLTENEYEKIIGSIKLLNKIASILNDTLSIFVNPRTNLNYFFKKKNYSIFSFKKKKKQLILNEIKKQKEIEIIQNTIEKYIDKKKTLQHELNARKKKQLKTLIVSGEYNRKLYTIDLYKSVYQNEINLGQFSLNEVDTFYYKNGDDCWNAPRRSTKIKLKCGPKVEIKFVNEIEKCYYYIELLTPMICKEYSEKELISMFKIDYSKL